MPYLTDQDHQRLKEQAPRTWQRMLSGRCLNLLEPSALDIEIHDIALGLARNTRWNGQTYGDHGWSVAQHSLLVVRILQTISPESPNWVLLAALLHDGAEYVTHDLITPLKAAVGDVFRVIEDRIQSAIFQAFDLPSHLPDHIKASIKKADLIAAATEAVQLAGFSPEDVKNILLIQEKPLMDLTLTPLPSVKVQADFLKKFERLYNTHRHTKKNLNFVGNGSELRF